MRFSGYVLGDALMAWDGAVWLKVQASFLLLLVVTAILWYLPMLAYLMVVSVWARRNAFLWAVLPPVAILAIEGLILQLEPLRRLPRPALHRLFRDPATRARAACSAMSTKAS